MNSKGITQTRDLCVAVGSIVSDALAANEDGNISKMEGVKLAFNNLSEVIAACSGIAEVPAELADIQPEEMDELYHATMTELQWPEHSINRDVFNIIFNLVWHAVNSWRLLQNTLNPPKASIVIEGVDPP